MGPPAPSGPTQGPADSRILCHLLGGSKQSREGKVYKSLAHACQVFIDDCSARAMMPVGNQWATKFRVSQKSATPEVPRGGVLKPAQHNRSSVASLFP